MFNKSIAYRLSIFISLAVIIVFVVFIIVLFFFNERLLRENIENRAISLSSLANSRISRNILTAKEVSLNVAEQIVYYSQNNDAEELLSIVMNKYPFLNSIFVKIDSLIPEQTYFLINRNKNDSIFYKESKQLIYSCEIEKVLFEDIFKTHKTGWTDPYKCNTSENVVVSFYCPITINAEDDRSVYAGHVICELSLYELNKIINRIQYKKHEYVFIVNNNGDYITHPNSEWILNRNIYNLPPGVLDIEKSKIDLILSGRSSGSLIAHPDIFNYEKSWVYYTPINDNRWILFFVKTYNELFKELYLLTIGLLSFALLAIVSICIIIKYISNKLIEPLSLLTSQLNRMTSPFSREKLKTHDEVKQVSDSLLYIRSQFERYRSEQLAEEKKRLRRHQDMLQASEIQQSLIKTDFKDFKDRYNIDLHAIYKPSAGVSGDLFDYYFIDDENLIFTIGDVSGSGVSAALFMSIAQIIIRTSAPLKAAKSIVSKTNNELFTSSDHQYFLTLFLAVLNIKTGELNYCNAAHTTSFILKSGGQIIELNKFHGLPLGLYSKNDYSDSKLLLEKGDSIILYTDGVTEEENYEKVHFGKKHFKDALHELTLTDKTASEMTKYIKDKLDKFRGDTPQTDDICLFIIKYTS
jgi:phosphoserine phosphatase RsbU/P